MKKFISRHPSSGVPLIGSAAHRECCSSGVLPGYVGDRNVLFNRDLAWVVIPEIPLTASRPALMIKLAERCGDCALAGEIRGRRFTAGRASTLRNVKGQSLYFGPPW